MAGHSKWANIKHRKGAQDAKRSKIFTKIIKELTIVLEKLNSDDSLNFDQKRNIELSYNDFKKKLKYSAKFVERQSLLISRAFQDWRIAKENNDFNIFKNSLSDLIELRKEECELIGYKNHPYDVLLDKYEPKLTTSEVDIIFNDVKDKLVPFIHKISKNNTIDDKFFYQFFDKSKQWDFGIELLKQMGYNFDSGRQDISAHPFSTHFSPQDCRVTTRIDENNLSDMIWSCIHEGGHALYEQGLLTENYGLPLGDSISLGIHESQSRLWENHVGRSIHYWKKNYSLLKSYFPEKLKNVDYKQFYNACNNVKSSLIRTNADELTYHLHVMISLLCITDVKLNMSIIGGAIINIGNKQIDASVSNKINEMKQNFSVNLYEQNYLNKQIWEK